MHRDDRDTGRISKDQKVYTQEHGALRALLGGIGTGNISVDSRGSFRDFEIFGHPDRGLKLPYHFFSLWTRLAGEKPDVRILEAAPPKSDRKAMYHSGELMGLPRFQKSRFICRFPFYEIELIDEELPFEVRLEAYTPFIPLDEDSSGMPFYQMTCRVKNGSDKEAEVSVASSILNCAGFCSYDGFDHLEQKGKRTQEKRAEGELRGLFLTCDGVEEDDTAYGSMALATPQDATWKTHWQYGGWWDGAQEFWQDFSEDGELGEPPKECGQTPQERCVSSAAVKQTLAPGEEKEFVFYTAWYFPNRHGWYPDGHESEGGEKAERIFRNYYSVLYKDAWDVLADAWRRRIWLEEKSRAFSDALYSSTLGADVTEALVTAVTAFRSCTCFRISDGTFFGWEGCFDHAGSCAGNCTHVWNYAQALAFLFPKLEQNMRITDFLTETDEKGCMAFRAKRRLEGKPWEMYPAADGQLGCILRAYREWKISGDEDFLKKIWVKVKQALAYACSQWDGDGDGVLEAMQHNTYDIEFYGYTSMTNSIFYAALLAAAQMAEHFQETELAQRYREKARDGSRKMEQLLWNGEYYRQKISQEDMERHSYQYGDGCLSDQIFGQELAHLYGLGYLFDESHVKSALRAVYRYNFKKTLNGHESVQRNYAMPDEPGLVLCSWPFGGRPEQPFVYSDEVWTGIEAQVAVHLIYEGMTDEGLEVLEAVRNRYDGFSRSPYDEAECGYHYVRSMAWWGLLPALSGYHCDMSSRELSFAPKVSPKDFQCFYSNAESWGIYKQWEQDGKTRWKIIPLYGTLKDVKVNGVAIKNTENKEQAYGSNT